MKVEADLEENERYCEVICMGIKTHIVVGFVKKNL